MLDLVAPYGNGEVPDVAALAGGHVDGGEFRRRQGGGEGRVLGLAEKAQAQAAFPQFGETGRQVCGIGALRRQSEEKDGILGRQPVDPGIVEGSGAQGDEGQVLAPAVLPGTGAQALQEGVVKGLLAPGGGVPEAGIGVLEAEEMARRAAIPVEDGIPADEGGGSLRGLHSRDGPGCRRGFPVVLLPK